MRPRTLLPRTLALLAFAASIAAAAPVTPALAAAPSEAKLEVNENCVEANWPCWATPGSSTPASNVTIATGGEVMFTDHASTAAAVVWAGSAPACTGVPTSATTGWEGKCKFEQAGTYKFESSTLYHEEDTGYYGGGVNYTKYEIVVEGAAAATAPATSPTATPTSPATTAPTTPVQPSHVSPLEGGSSALELAGSQQGSTVRGQVKLSQAGSGGRLEVSLLATGASLATAGRHPAQVRVGRLARSSLHAGSLSFAVSLTATGKAALRRHQHLTLTVKVTLTPQHGAAVKLTRVVTMHARRREAGGY